MTSDAPDWDTEAFLAATAPLWRPPANTLLRAVGEVLEEYFETPDSPEGFAAAMYQLRRLYGDELARAKDAAARRAMRKKTRKPAA